MKAFVPKLFRRKKNENIIEKIQYIRIQKTPSFADDVMSLCLRVFGHFVQFSLKAPFHSFSPHGLRKRTSLWELT